MNVTLPENKEINKKRIILYSIAIFICILSIIIIIGIQILGNDVVDEFFGIIKITKKTEEQEEELKANFETLFQNQLENKNNNEVKKIDDDKEIVNAIEIYLEKEGYQIYKAYNGKEALKTIDSTELHLVILDIMMPELDGISVAEKVRKDKAIPIIMLSAKSEDYDKIKGLNVGADDYITKPFNPMELVARVNSQIRRYTKLGSINKKEENEDIYKSGELVIDDSKKEVTVDGKNIKLTPTEYNILKFLTKNKGKVFSISQIYENVWEEESYGAENIIAVHIRHIREKIEIDPKEPKYLKVIWGIGYKIEKI